MFAATVAASIALPSEQVTPVRTVSDHRLVLPSSFQEDTMPGSSLPAPLTVTGVS
jgi:hypothetical protein